MYQLDDTNEGGGLAWREDPRGRRFSHWEVSLEYRVGSSPHDQGAPHDGEALHGQKAFLAWPLVGESG